MSDQVFQLLKFYNDFKDAIGWGYSVIGSVWDHQKREKSLNPTFHVFLFLGPKLALASFSHSSSKEVPKDERISFLLKKSRLLFVYCIAQKIYKG